MKMLAFIITVVSLIVSMTAQAAIGISYNGKRLDSEDGKTGAIRKLGKPKINTEDYLKWEFPDAIIEAEFNYGALRSYTLTKEAGKVPNAFAYFDQKKFTFNDTVRLAANKLPYVCFGVIDEKAFSDFFVSSSEEYTAIRLSGDYTGNEKQSMNSKIYKLHVENTVDDLCNRGY